MDRRNGIIFGVLTILIAAFIAFVVIMQYNFTNPEFTFMESEETTVAETETENSDESDETNAETDTTTIEGDNEQSEQEEEVEAEETEEEVITYSTRTVTVDSLNVRSGPGTEYEIAGVVTLDQELEVEDSGDEWVKITADNFTGYVNEKYLSEEN